MSLFAKRTTNAFLFYVNKEERDEGKREEERKEENGNRDCAKTNRKRS